MTDDTAPRIHRDTPSPGETLVVFWTTIDSRVVNVQLRATDDIGDGSDAAIEAAARMRLPQPATPDTLGVSQPAELVDATTVAVAAVDPENAPAVDAAVRDLDSGNAANQAQRDDEAAQYNATHQHQ